MTKHKLEFTDEELDIITTLLDMCCRSTTIIADDPNDFNSGLHFFERTDGEKELAKKIIQKIGKECL